MFGLDQLISGLGDGSAPLVVLAIAVLLGLRHATDPDHLVAVSTLVATERERPARRASVLGLGWGLGHATTVVALGLPVAFVGDWLPRDVQRAAELAVGLVVMALAVRLIRRWRAGAFHAHVHVHDGVAHRHLHRHEPGRAATPHDHEHVRIRSPLQAYGVGLVHGVGGSAAVGVLLLASIADHVDAILAFLLFAAAAALSMGALSLGLGLALGTEPARRRLTRLAPVLGSLSFLFGAWYAAAALL